MKLTHEITISDKFAEILDRIFIPNNDLKDIKRSLQNIMSAQTDFDAKITKANEALDAIGTAIAAEAQQIADFIAANPSVNTSALDGVVSRLESVDESVNTVFDANPTPPQPTPDTDPETDPTEVPTP